MTARYADQVCPRRRAVSGAAVSRGPRLANIRALLPVDTLPHELNCFVGRQEEVAAIAQELRDGASLLTLTGMGGVGKTRLATHAAAQAQSNYSNGARLVLLAQLHPEAGTSHQPCWLG